MTTRIASLAAAVAAVVLLGSALPPSTLAADKTAVIAFEQAPDPEKVAVADNLYEKQTGYKIDWRPLETGAEIIAAMAGGSVDIGYIGSSPTAVAATRALPIKLILVDEIGESEELVVRDGAGISKPADLTGKKLGVPFVSTAHYSVLAALKHWGLGEKDVNILNLDPSDIAAAWLRGDIDAAYIWDPQLTLIKKNGRVLISSADLAKLGSPTFNGYVVTKSFAAANPEFLKTFVKITQGYRESYTSDPSKWDAQSQQVLKISKVTGMKPADIPGVLAGLHYPTTQQLLSAQFLGGGTAVGLKKTAQFLYEQKKLPKVLDDYSDVIDTSYLQSSVASN